MRAIIGGIGDSLDAKFPLAYAQFVQVLVDIFLALAPFALYPALGIWSVFAVGILNIFFSGLNDLAKILLDPLDNSDSSFYRHSSVNMDVGVLIRKSNASSNRWKSGLEQLPFEYRE
jgi:predicted membrane chloride channel (bestrophin family)